MVSHATQPEPENLESRLDAALSSLESALAQASQAVVDIRDVLPQVVGLAELVGEMEAAMSRVRQHLGVPPSDAPRPAVAIPTLRPVPPPEDQTEPEEPPRPEPAPPEATRVEPAEAVPPQPVPAEVGRVEPAEAAPTVTVSEEATEASRPESHCLRLDVALESGSLDLKAVDNSVSESPAVVDVALLDYDGRHATLKLWVDGSADAESVRATLLESLRRHLGDSGKVEVDLDSDREQEQEQEQDPLF